MKILPVIALIHWMLLWHLLSACVLGPRLSALNTLFLIFTFTSLGMSYFIPEETEFQKDWVTCLWSVAGSVPHLNPKPIFFPYDTPSPMDLQFKPLSYRSVNLLWRCSKKEIVKKKKERKCSHWNSLQVSTN